MTDVVKQELDEQGILTLTLNRPDKLNALNNEVLSTLADCFRQARSSKAVKGILITGEGKAFCAGADIERLAECNVDSGYAFSVEGQRIFRLLETLGKPSIAAINGYAFGGGCELAMAASLRIAASHAQFGQPEIKLGIIPGYGGTQRLTRLVGRGRALDLCLTGRFISAEVALNWGLVNEVVEGEKLLTRAKSLLLSILNMAPLAIKSVLEVIDRGSDLSLDNAMHLEALHFARTCASEDKNEGVSAFIAKRTPKFKGN